MNPCIVPSPGNDADGDDRWMSQHKRFLSECREKDPDIIFIGDCILENLQHTDTWNQYFAPMHCLNFSIRNDKTENVLWRIENGELDNVKPKIIVLHVGTNNVDNKPEHIADGIFKIIEKIRQKHPDVYIVLPTLLPRGQQPNHLRDKNIEVNKIVKKRLCGSSGTSGGVDNHGSDCSGDGYNLNNNKIQQVIIDNGLIQSDGTISHHDMYDYLNLTNSGCKKVFEPVYDLLSQILNENEQEKDLTPSE